MPIIKIGQHWIGPGNPPFLIAEAGVNHNGRLKTALRLVDAAASSGAQAIKFQTFKANEVVTAGGQMAAYQKKNIGKTESQLDMLEKLELKDTFYKTIIDRCKQKKIIFMSTPHGSFNSVDRLRRTKMAAYKIGSGDLTNLPLLRYIAHLKKPIIISTGMATMAEIKEAIKEILSAGNEQIIALHCTTAYPAPLDEVNLNAMRSMMDQLGVLIGYSDHTTGTQTPIMAATLGACLIEKHFTLDKSMPGPDHKASIEPTQLKELAIVLGNIMTILGSSTKRPTAGESKISNQVRKSLVSLSDIKKGQPFTKANLGIKRPGTGLAPKHYDFLLTKKASRKIAKDKLITKADYA